MRFLFLTLFLSFSLNADVIYKKTQIRDAFGNKIVTLKIQNLIKKGDFETFQKAVIDINQNNYRLDEDSVFLNSEGGNVYEATQIGKLIRRNHFATKVNRHDYCNSACNHILFAGTCRMALGDVGVHRGRTDEHYTDKSLAKNMTIWTDSIDEEYFKKMNAPQSFIDIQQTTPNWDMINLTEEQKSLFGLYVITHAESVYRQEIASRKLGISKKELIDNLMTKRFVFGLGLKRRKPSCSEQFFMDQLEQKPHLNDSFTINNFEVDEVRQFYIKVDKNGEPIKFNDQIREFHTKQIPLEDGVVYVWEIKHHSNGEKVTYREVTTLVKPTQWKYEKVDGVEVLISPDNKKATREITTDNVGNIMGGWSLNTKYDKKGPVKVEIFIGLEKVQEFNFEII